MTDFILRRTEAGVCVLTFNRPERLNAWSPAMSERYFDLLDECAADADVRVIVVTGTGRGFCAGMDVGILQNIGTTAPRSDPDTRKALYTRTIPKPVIAAINGACVGVGFVLAACCDVRFAAAQAKLSTIFARRGLPAEDGISWLLPRLIGAPAALDLLLTGRIIRAEEAHTMGFVSNVYPPEVLLEEVLRYAEDMAANCSPAAMAMIKRQLYADIDRDLATAVQDSRDVRDEAVVGADFLEGVESYLAKRKPRFAPISARGSAVAANRAETQ